MWKDVTESSPTWLLSTFFVIAGSFAPGFLFVYVFMHGDFAALDSAKVILLAAAVGLAPTAPMYMVFTEVLDANKPLGEMKDVDEARRYIAGGVGGASIIGSFCLWIPMLVRAFVVISPRSAVMIAVALGAFLLFAVGLGSLEVKRKIAKQRAAEKDAAAMKANVPVPPHPEAG
jgi:hypothetical protein